MRIFISYRHSDAIAGTAELIFERLGRIYGKDRVFLDNASLPVAESFPEQLRARLHECDVFLALIDRHWLASMPRLHDAQDWVRRELEVALQRRANGLMLIPVLLQQDRMPEADKLPLSLAELATLQAPPPLRSAWLTQDIALLKLYIEGWTLAQLQAWLLARTRAAWRVSAGLVLLGLLAMTALLDVLTIDTRLEALTMGVADVIVDEPPDQRLAMVVIDAQTEQALGKPLLRPAADGGLVPEFSWRADHAALIDRLSAAGARAVAFDIHMGRPSPRHDGALRAAAARARARGTAVIFGAPQAGQPPLLAPPDVVSALLCVGEMLELSRTVPLVVRRPVVPAGGPAVDGVDTPESLAVVLGALSGMAALAPGQVRAAEPAPEPAASPAPARLAGLWPARWPLPVASGPTTVVRDARACPALVQGDRVDQLYLRYSPLDTLRDPVRRLRYEDVLAGGPAADAARWAGKIVLVGVGALQAGAVDQRTVLRGLLPEQRMGYEVHADAINTLLTDTHIVRAPTWLQAALLLVMAGLGMLGRFWRRLWTPRRGLLFCLAVALAYLGLGALLCAHLNLLLDCSYHIAAMLLGYEVSARLLRDEGFWLREKTA